MDNSQLFKSYADKVRFCLDHLPVEAIDSLINDLKSAWSEKNHLFLCGNGGSAGNAIHVANDFLFGVDRESGVGMRVTALSANPAVLTCLANDISYEDIYSQQLKSQANAGDVLIVLSGSGNSPNILKALQEAREMGLRSYAILGYSGGRALELADVAIHFEIDDMQVSEDMQLIVLHIVMQALCKSPS